MHNSEKWNISLFYLFLCWIKQLYSYISNLRHNTVSFFFQIFLAVRWWSIYTFKNKSFCIKKSSTYAHNSKKNQIWFFEGRCGIFFSCLLLLLKFWKKKDFSNKMKDASSKKKKKKTKTLTIYLSCFSFSCASCKFYDFNNKKIKKEQRKLGMRALGFLMKP